LNNYQFPIVPTPKPPASPLGNQSFSMTNTLGVSSSQSPYQSGTGFVNANGFQIISAGYDQQFGNTTTAPTTGVGADDQANFSKTLLGGGIN